MVTNMSESKKVLHFPTVSRPSIEEVLTLFLKDQQKRLKPRTFNRYEEVIDLLRHCLNGHGYHDLDNSSEVALYEKLYFQKNLEFCFIFGPEKIVASLGNFLNYFMIRKVMASEALLQAAGIVTQKTGKVARGKRLHWKGNGRQGRQAGRRGGKRVARSRTACKIDI